MTTKINENLRQVSDTPQHMNTVAQALTQAHTQGLARVDAQMLLLHTLGQPTHARAWLITHDSDALSPAQQAQWQQMLAQRQAGVPVAYLTGHKAFYGLDLRVDARVLDPRDDTETLVDWALDVLTASGQAQPRVLDLGTGSGAIALALASALPRATVCAVDASVGALAVARANAERLALPVQFHLGDWFAGLPACAARFDCIASNPPYIRDDDPHMAALQHEPRQALTSGADGLADIRVIAAGAPAWLVRGGWLLLEHGWDQHEAVQALLRKAGFGEVQSRQDLAGQPRCTGGRWLA